VNLTQRRYFWYGLAILLLLSGPITAFATSPVGSAFSSPVQSSAMILRLSGTISFVLLFILIVLGSQLNKWIQIIGGKAYRLHTFLGVITYGLILIHPLTYFVFSYQILDAFVPVLIPSLETRREFWLNFGRFAFYFVTLGVVAGRFRQKPFFRKNWRYFHIINYLTFYFVAIHAWFVGTDTRQAPFVWVYWLSVLFVSIIVLHKLSLVIRSVYLRYSSNKDSNKLASN